MNRPFGEIHISPPCRIVDVYRGGRVNSLTQMNSTFPALLLLLVVMDERDYNIIEAFAEMFAEDNPTAFDKAAFRDAVYDAHSRKSSSSKERWGRRK
jgi:hypothetical protein